jgi:hypothetical protein
MGYILEHKLLNDDVKALHLPSMQGRLQEIEATNTEGRHGEQC